MYGAVTYAQPTYGGSSGSQVVELTASETATGTDSQAIVVELTASETATGADAATTTAAFTGTETGSGADVATISQTATETGSGVDSSPTPGVSTGTGSPIRIVQTVTYVGTGSATIAAATAGNTLIVSVISQSSQTTPTGYTQADHATDDAEMYVWYKIATGGETSFTPVYSPAPVGAIVVVYEVAGLAAAPLDQTVVTVAPNTEDNFSPGTTGVLAQPDEFVLAAVGSLVGAVGHGREWSNWTNSFVEDSDNNSGTTSDHVSMSVAHKVTNSTAAVTTSPKAWNASNFVGIIATFKANTTGEDAYAEDVATISRGTQNFFGTVVPTNPDIVDAGPLTLGLNFQVRQDGYILGVRFYKSVNNTGTHVAGVWQRDSWAGTWNGTPLISENFTGETSSGWQEHLFSTPVAVTPYDDWEVGVFMPNGRYAADGSYFGSKITENELEIAATAVYVNGLYNYAGSITRPDAQFGQTNYYVDVMFATELVNEDIDAADTGTGADAQTIAATQVETASGNDVATTTAAVTATETTSGADAAAISLAGVETGSGAEGESPAAADQNAETASGSDAATTTAALTQVETASVVDAATIVASFTTTETAAGVDAQTIAATFTTATDSASGGDSAAISEAVTEAASGTDAATTAAALTATDTSTAAEAATSTATFSQDDTATGTDNESVFIGGLSFSEADTASGVDSASIAQSNAETATGVETESYAVAVFVDDTVLAAEMAVLEAIFSTADTSDGTDFAWVKYQDLLTPFFATAVDDGANSSVLTHDGQNSSEMVMSGITHAVYDSVP